LRGILIKAIEGFVTKIITVTRDGFNQNVSRVIEAGIDNTAVETPILISIIEINITKSLTKMSKLGILTLCEGE